MIRTWVLTVSSVTPCSLAISLFVRPSAIPMMTPSSRSVMGSPGLEKRPLVCTHQPLSVLHHQHQRERERVVAQLVVLLVVAEEDGALPEQSVQHVSSVLQLVLR